MNKKNILKIGAFILLLGTIIALNTNAKLLSEGKNNENEYNIVNSNQIIEVDVDGGKDYTCIQEAIDGALPYDKILVYSGDYYESIKVDKPLKIEGIIQANEDKPIIYGNFADDNLEVNLYKNTTNLNNFKIFGGIKISASHCSISDIDLDASEEFYGIDVEDARSTSILDCNIENSNYGIRLINSDFSYIKNCNIKNNKEYGIYVDNSCQIKIEHNIISNYHQFGINCIGEYIEIKSNRLYSDKDCLTVGLGCSFESGQIYENSIENNYFGILLSAYDSDINDNRIENNKYGLFISDSINCKIYNNFVSNNTKIGIELNAFVYNWNSIGECHNNIIYDNKIKNNKIGINISDNHGGFVYDNLIYGNYFIKNKINAHDITSNYWCNKDIKKGNYWSDYIGVGVYNIKPNLEKNIDTFPKKAVDQNVKFSQNLIFEKIIKLITNINPSFINLLNIIL